MSKSTHQFEVKGVDKSAGAFSSIKGRAATTAAQIRSMVGGAIAAAGAYMSIRAIKGGIDELGHLSDIAQKTSTSVDELTAAAQAMNILGIQNMGVDQLGKAFDYMAKTTGRSGMEGFYQTIGELGKIPDVAKRGQEAMRIFGRSGMEFMPLINAANNGTDALQNVIDAMPMVPQAAADAGDAVSDAMSIVASGVHSIWLQAISKICEMFGYNFPDGVRQGAAAASAYMEYFAKVSGTILESTWYRLKNFYGFKDKISGAVGGFFSGLFSGKNPFKEAKDAWNYWDDFYEQRVDEIEKPLDKQAELLAVKLAKIAKLQVSYDKAAISTAKRLKLDKEKFGAVDMKTQTRISNDLIMGGSNAATRLQLLGPTLQSESKKQTSLLEKIATNTEKTADNTEETASGEDMGVID